VAREGASWQTCRVDVLLYALGAIALVAGVAGLVLPMLPGALLMVLGVVLVAWAGHFQIVGWGTVAFSVLVAVAITAVDWGASLLGARAFGASRWAVIGSALGLLVGMFLGFPGILLGPAVGAVVLEYLKDPNFQKAAKAGVGAFLGFVVGSVLKISLAFFLVGVLLLAFLLRP
jgi:uncharacterized protein YqgC (DUF456 family)